MPRSNQRILYPSRWPIFRATRPFEAPFFFFLFLLVFFVFVRASNFVILSCYTPELRNVHEEGWRGERDEWRMLLVKVKARRGISDVENTARRQLHRKITSVRTHSPSLKNEGRERLRLFLRESPCDATRREKLPSVPGLKLSSRCQRGSVLLFTSPSTTNVVEHEQKTTNSRCIRSEPSFGPACIKRRHHSAAGPPLCVYISGSKNLPCQSSLFHTPSTVCSYIPYAYPVQLVTEPRQGLLPCILHASLHVLVVHIT